MKEERIMSSVGFSHDDPQYQSFLKEVRQKVLGSPFFNIFAEFTVGPFADYEVAEMLARSHGRTFLLEARAK